MSDLCLSAERRSTIRAFSGRTALVAAAVAGTVGFLQPAAFWPVWLLASVFVVGIGLGSLAVIRLHRLTGGRWGMAVLRELTAAAGTLPLMSVLLIGLIPGAAHLYPWLGEASANAVLNAHQANYFAPAAWVARGVVYVLIWTALAVMSQRAFHRLTRSSQRSDWLSQQRRNAIGLILFWLTTSFAAFDWLMSLEPQWVSTIYGALIAMEFVVGAWAVIIVLRCRLSGPLPSAVRQDLGNMLLAFLLVWAYFGFSQFLIIWSGDQPHEIPWYARRIHGIWGAAGTLLLVFHFVIPFALLLSREQKRSSRSLIRLATGLLVMRVVGATWVVLPAFDPIRLSWLILVPATVTAASAFWLWHFLARWERLAPVPATLLHPAGEAPADASLTQEALS